jgi:lipoprotein signal peptidase
LTVNPFTVAWILWILAFVVIEYLAIRREAKGDTLTEHIVDWFSTTKRGMAWGLRRLLLAVFLAWLTIHFFLGGAF